MSSIYLVAPKEKSVKEAVILFEKTHSDIKQKNRLYDIYTKRIPENIGIGAIAQYLIKNGVEAKCVNMYFERNTMEKIVDEIIKTNPVIVGVSLIYDLHVFNAIKLITLLRYKGYSGHITLGGTFISLAYTRFLKNFDYIDSIIIGNGEMVFYKLYRALTTNGNLYGIPGLALRDKNGNIEYEKQNYYENYVFSVPLRKTLDYALSQGLQIQTALIVGSRGCNNNCIYCAAPNMRRYHNKIWIGRNPVDLVDEIEQLINKYNIKYLYFCDDNFCGYGKTGSQHLKMFIQEMKNRNLFIRFHAEIRADAGLSKEDILGLRSVGLDEALIGLESGVTECLKRWKKNTNINDNQSMINLLKECKVKIAPAYILIDPYTTLEELEQSFKFIYTNDLYLADDPWYLFNQMIVYPGTELENQLIEQQIITPKTVRYYTLDELQKDENILKFCYDISVIEYEIVSSDVRQIWDSLKKAVNEIIYIVNKELPTFAHSIKQLSGNALDFIIKVQKWRKNIGYLHMNLLKSAIDWGKSQHKKKSLDEILLIERTDYDIKYLGKSFSEFINE